MARAIQTSDTLQKLGFRLVHVKGNDPVTRFAGRYLVLTSSEPNIAPIRIFAFDENGHCWEIQKEMDPTQSGLRSVGDLQDILAMVGAIFSSVLPSDNM